MSAMQRRRAKRAEVEAAQDTIMHSLAATSLRGLLAR